MRKHVTWASVLAIALFVGSGNLCADAIVYEPFLTGSTPANGEYATGSILNQGPDTTGFDQDVDWSGYDCFDVDDTGLSYTDGNGNVLDVDGGLVEFSSLGSTAGSGNGLVKRVPTSGLSSSLTQYMSFLVNFNENALGSCVLVSWGVGDQGVGFNSSHQLAYYTGYAAGSPHTTDTYATGTTHLVVAKFEDGTLGGISHDRISIWVDPILSAEGTPTLLDNINWPGSSHLDLSLLTIWAGGPPEHTPIVGVQFDEIRIGTTWAEVAPYSTGVIPEPATMLLLGTGVLGLIGFARRRRMG